MKNTVQTTLILTLILGGLVAWYLIYEKKVKPKRTEGEEKSKQIVSLDKDEIREIVLEKLKEPSAGSTGKTYEKIYLRKTGSDWNILEPLEDTADTGSISSMLSSITSTKQERTVEDSPKDLEAYGLLSPQFRFTVKKDSQSEGHQVLIGKDTPVGYSIYAKTASSPSVYRVSKSLRSAIEKDLTSLRNKTVLSIPRADINEMEIQTAKETFLLKTDDKDSWSLAKENLPADINEVNKTVNALLDTRATGFGPQGVKDLGAFGLKNPSVRITLTKKDKTKTTLFLGKASDKIHAKREDKSIIYIIDKDILEKSGRPSSAYRNMNLANFNRFDVRRIKIERGKELIELLKEDKGWTSPVEPTLKIDDSKVDGLLTRVQDTKISKYEHMPMDLKDPELVVRLFEKKDNAEMEKITLKFKKARNKEILVERAGLTLPFNIKEEDFRKISVSKQELIKLEEPIKPTNPEKKDTEKKS